MELRVAGQRTRKKDVSSGVKYKKGERRSPFWTSTLRPRPLHEIMAVRLAQMRRSGSR